MKFYDWYGSGMGGGCGPASSEPTALPKKRFEINLKKIGSFKDLKTIVQDSDTFWLAFCKSFGLHKYKVYKPDEFDVEISEQTLKIYGSKHTISKLKQFIEEMRHIIFDNDMKKNPVLVAFPIGIDDKYYIKKKQDIVDLSADQNHVQLYKDWFNYFVKPTLPELFRSVGAKYSEGSIYQKVKSEYHLDGTFIACKIEATEVI